MAKWMMPLSSMVKPVAVSDKQTVINLVVPTHEVPAYDIIKQVIENGAKALVAGPASKPGPGKGVWEMTSTIAADNPVSVNVKVDDVYIDDTPLDKYLEHGATSKKWDKIEAGLLSSTAVPTDVPPAGPTFFPKKYGIHTWGFPGLPPAKQASVHNSVKNLNKPIPSNDYPQPTWGVADHAAFAMQHFSPAWTPNNMPYCPVCGGLDFVGAYVPPHKANVQDINHRPWCPVPKVASELMKYGFKTRQ